MKALDEVSTTELRTQNFSPDFWGGEMKRGMGCVGEDGFEINGEHNGGGLGGSPDEVGRKNEDGVG